MVRGLYTSAWSMLSNSKQLDVITNNLANADTTAYKKDTLIYESFPKLLTKRINDIKSPTNPSGNIGEMSLGSDVGKIFTYYTQGQLIKTDNPYDLAIDNSANSFFTVRLANQDQKTEYYTRDGAFTTNANNQLVTKHGDLVLGENGPITIDSFEQFKVQPDGTILQGDNVIDKLKIKTFSDTEELRKYGHNLVYATDNAEEQTFEGTIIQGYTEQSNVNIINEMVNMINVMRSYEANQKVLQQHDALLGKAVNEVGAVR